MDIFDELVSTQYSDYKGKIEFDTHDSRALSQICRDHGIDTNQYFPIGFSLYEESSLGLDETSDALLSVYVVDKSVAGNSYDEIQRFIRKNTGEISVIEKSISMPYSKFFNYFKRCSLAVFQNGFEEVIRKINIEED